jgi:glycosyltransferase involved in cell wall biosynthesis
VQASVIICSHNPRPEYLRRVLVALEAQTLPRSEWELLLIDNRSAEPLAESLDLSWHPHSRIVREEALGLSNARVRGISESRGDILVFVDDDNVLDADYLTQAVRIGAEWPQLGIWGGSAIPEFEIEPPEHLRPHLYCLALREVKTQQWSNVWSRQEAEPHGTGLCIRQPAAVAYRDFYLSSKLPVGDRSGTALLSGGDTEMAFFVCSIGLGMGVFPELRLVHLIPRARLTEDYIARISEGLETSSMLLFYKWAGHVPSSPFSPVGVARFAKHLIFSRGLNRKLAFGRMRAARRVRKLVLNPPEATVAANNIEARDAQGAIRKSIA